MSGWWLTTYPESLNTDEPFSHIIKNPSKTRELVRLSHSCIKSHAGPNLKAALSSSLVSSPIMASSSCSSSSPANVQMSDTRDASYRHSYHRGNSPHRHLPTPFCQIKLFWNKSQAQRFVWLSNIKPFFEIKIYISKEAWLNHFKVTWSQIGQIGQTK